MTTLLSEIKCRSLNKILLLTAYLLVATAEADYRVGVGISDVTGPIAEVTLMGYAKAGQIGTGLHLRQFARAFIIEDDHSRFAFVNVDCHSVTHGLRKQVLDLIEKQYGNTYSEQNVIISGTHTHSGTGGFMMDILFDITSFGFVPETFNALVSGIVKAFTKAHHSIQDAKIFINSGTLLNANINRSPGAYLRNPESERKQYKYDVDKEITQLKFISTANNRLLGAINWFAVHPTSMNNTNTLVSSDNVGYASILLEQHFNKGSFPGNGTFVAGFASSNLGDVSPNIKGPYCVNSGLSCENEMSTCNGEDCVSLGPGKDMFDSTRIIGERLYNKAVELLESPTSREVKGQLRIGHRYVDMPTEVNDYTMPNGTTAKVHGCLPAMGYSFAAGTTDGAGEFEFKQGTVTDDILWNTIRNFIATPGKEDIACQSPKPILLATGLMNFPYQWQPRIVSIQTAVLGDVVIAAVPGEFTTMAGRRLRRAISKVVQESTVSREITVIIAGLSNIYSDYIVTPEEYGLQRYEAASTIYGPYTLPIYLDLYSKLVESLFKGTVVNTGPEPPDLSRNLISLTPPVIFDRAGLNTEFGHCTRQPPSTVKLRETVIAAFVAGHPRNNVMHGKTFLVIEKMTAADEWTVIATDANWETKFKWRRTSFLMATSEATVEWTVSGKDVTTGTYRIRHFGYYKYVLGGIFPYEGITNNFEVI